MAQIWDYIAQYNPTGFYEDNRSKSLRNDYMNTQISAANQAAAREKKIMDLQDAWAKGDSEALRQLGIYSPETTKKYVENADEMLSIARPMAESVLRVAPENRAKAYQQMLQGLRNKNVDVSDMPMEYDEEMIMALANSDPTKIRDERLNEQAEQRAQNAFNRSLAQLQYQNALSTQKAEAERQRRLDYLEGIKEQMTPEQYAATKSSIMGVDYTPMTPAEVALNDYLQTGNPDALSVIQRQGEAAKLLSTKNTSDSANIQANNKYEAWERENPDATEADKRNARFQYGIPNADDKAWLEQKKQQAKDDVSFTIEEGFATTPKEAMTLLGINNTTSPVGQQINKDLTNDMKESNRDKVMKGLTGIKSVDKAYLKKAGENIAKEEENTRFIEEQKASLIPALIDAYKAAEDGTGLGVISGRVSPHISSGKASDNLSKVETLINMTGPVMVSKLKAAGAGARSFDSEGERKAYLPNFEVTQSPNVIKNKIREFSKKMLGVNIEEEIKKINNGKTEESVIDFTEYFGE